jgi:hypothetical protein
MPTSQPVTNLGEIVDDVLVATRPYVARLNRLGVQFRSNPSRPGAFVDVPVVQIGEATEFDRSTNNYGDSSGAITVVQVPLSSHPKTTLAVTPEAYDALGDGGTLAVDAVAKEQAGIEVGTAALRAYHNLLPGASATTSPAMTLASHTSGAAMDKDDFAAIQANVLSGFAAAGGRPKYAGAEPANCSLVLSATAYATACKLYDAGNYRGGDGPNPTRDGWFDGGLLGFRDVIADPMIPSTIVGYVVPRGSLALAVRPVAVRNPDAYAYAYREDDRSGLTLTIRTKVDTDVDDRITTVEALFGGVLAFPAQVLVVKPHA